MPNRKLWEKFRNRLWETIKFLGRLNPITKPRLAAGLRFMRKSWKSIAIVLPGALVLYYVVGSWATHNIDKSLEVEIIKPQKGLALTDAAANLIKREVDDKMWTPNLPIIFPGYVLDNMPSYQLGIIESMRLAAKALAQNFDSPNLSKAVELLSYPGNIWLLSKTENLALAPSSGAQYRKARKALLRFNEETLAETKSPKFLISSLELLQKNSKNIIDSLEKQVREHSDALTDNQADNVFYFNQGRMYGYYVILKALGEDFKGEILEAGQYEAWTSLLKTLSDGFDLQPIIVRNGETDSLTAPNHLLALDFYVVKTRCQLMEIIAALKTPALKLENVK